MVRVYFGRVIGVRRYWCDVFVTPDFLFNPSFSRFRYMLIDVGLSALVRRYGRVFYPRWWLDKYVCLCRGFYDAFPGRVMAIVPDFPPIWSGAPTEGYMAGHYELLEEFSRLEDPFWVAVFRFEGLAASEIERAAEEHGEVLDRFKAIAIPAMNPMVSRAGFMEAVRAVKKLFPDKWIHLLGPRDDIIRICYPGICDSLDFGWSVTRFSWFKRELAEAIGLEKSRVKMFRSARLDAAGKSAAYELCISNLIGKVERHIGEVDGWLEDEE